MLNTVFTVVPECLLQLRPCTPGAQAEEEAARQRRLAAALRERLARAKKANSELDARARMLERLDAFAYGCQSACMRGFTQGLFKETY